MSDLIAALQIFLKYKDEQFPTHCEHDVLLIMGITKEEISEEDVVKLYRLNFSWFNEFNCWGSFRFGSA